MEKQRLSYLDVVKGLLIIYLPFCHFLSAASKLGIDVGTFPSMRPSFITCFFMPAFFIVSGYCSSFSKPWNVVLNKIFRGLIVPWIIFQIIIVLCLGGLYGSFKYAIQILILPPNTSLWFLPALAVGKILISFLKRNLKNDMMVLLVSLGFMLLGIILGRVAPSFNYMAIYQSLIASFYICLGSFFKEHQKIYELCLKYSTYFFLVLFGVLYALKIHVPSFAGGSVNISIVDLPLHLLLAVAGSLTLFRFCRWLDHNRLIEFWGRNTLVVYGLHFIILMFLLKGYSVCLNMLHPYLFLCLVYSSLFIACFFCVILFEKTPLRVVVGKK